MSRNRGAVVGLAVAVLAAGAGAFSPARAQASGNLQASVTVIDDLVSRTVTARLAAVLKKSTRSATSDSPHPSIDPRDGVAATLVELEPRGRLRRFRVEIIYLH
jgi:hypothetical protein